MIEEKVLTGIATAAVTTIGGFPALCLVHLYRHGNRLSDEVKNKDALLQDKTTALTDALVRAGKLEEKISHLQAENARLSARIAFLEKEGKSN